MARRRPGISNSYDTDCSKYLAFLIEGLGRIAIYNVIDKFRSWEHLEATFDKHRSYLLNLYFYGDEGGFIGGYDYKSRPAGWWYAESPIKDMIRSEKSGVIGDKVFIDMKFYDELKEYAIKSDHQNDYFSLDQAAFLEDHDLLFNKEK